MSKNIIQLNEEAVKDELKELVRKSMEETLNELLDKEAEELTCTARYERSEARQGYRSSHYSRKLTTTSGEVQLNIPKLKGVSFETAIIERYRRRESSVEEALIEMYLAGVSVRRVEDIREALWGSRVSASTLNKKAYVHIEEWRNRALTPILCLLCQCQVACFDCRNDDAAKCNNRTVALEFLDNMRTVVYERGESAAVVVLSSF